MVFLRRILTRDDCQLMQEPCARNISSFGLISVADSPAPAFPSVRASIWRENGFDGMLGNFGMQFAPQGESGQILTVRSQPVKFRKNHIFFINFWNSTSYLSVFCNNSRNPDKTLSNSAKKRRILQETQHIFAKYRNFEHPQQVRTFTDLFRVERCRSKHLLI